ncbi:MAG: hypothetical protein ACI86L_001642 [Dokdonia sp.]|jgi:hypothetical protein
MKRILLSLSTLLLLSACSAQSSVIATNADGSVTLFNNGNSTQTVTVTPSGNMGIGKANPTDKLEVNGQIHAKSVKVDLQEWADFVFKEGYDLVGLREIEAYIITHGHLPEIPSETQVLTDGIDLGTMNLLLLQKVEELTLHLIAKDKEITRLQKQFSTIDKRLERLESSTPNNHE